MNAIQQIEMHFCKMRKEIGKGSSIALDATVAAFPTLNPFFVRTHIRYSELWQ